MPPRPGPRWRTWHPDCRWSGVGSESGRCASPRAPSRPRAWRSNYTEEARAQWTSAVPLGRLGTPRGRLRAGMFPGVTRRAVTSPGPRWCRRRSRCLGNRTSRSASGGEANERHRRPRPHGAVRSPARSPSSAPATTRRSMATGSASRLYACRAAAPVHLSTGAVNASSGTDLLRALADCRAGRSRGHRGAGRRVSSRPSTTRSRRAPAPSSVSPRVSPNSAPTDGPAGTRDGARSAAAGARAARAPTAWACWTRPPR